MYSRSTRREMWQCRHELPEADSMPQWHEDSARTLTTSDRGQVCDMTEKERSVGDAAGEPQPPQQDLELRVAALEDKLARLEGARLEGERTDLDGEDQAFLTLMRYGPTHLIGGPLPPHLRDLIENLPDWFLSRHC